MKKKTLTILLSSILAIALSAAIIVGATLSFLPSDTALNISLVAGQLNVGVEIADLTMYSAEPDKKGDIVDENGGTYSYKKYSRFKNGGEAKLNREDASITVTGISPGDKFDVTLSVTNNSSIGIRYQTAYVLLNQASSDLFDQLKMTTTIKDDGGVKALASTEEPQAKLSEEGKLAVNSSCLAIVSVELPITAQNVQNVTIQTKCVLSATQDAQELDAIAIIERNGEIVKAKSMSKIVELAEDGETIYVLCGSNASEKVVVDKNLTIKSYNDEVFTFKDLRFEIKDVTLTLSDLKFTGNSYVDVSESFGFVMQNCVVEATPDRVYDSTAEAYLEKAAFIAGSKLLRAGIKLDICNNVFKLPAEADTSEYAAIYVATTLSNGCVFRGNVFGTAEKPYETALYIKSVVERGVLSVDGNTFYAANAVSVGTYDADIAYSVKLSGNKLYGTASKLVTVENEGVYDIYDTGSLVNGSAITTADFTMGANKHFVGVNVVFYESGLDGINVSAGTFRLADGYSQSTFLSNYTVSDRVSVQFDT